MRKALKDFYGTNPLKSKHLARIVNDNQFQRLKRLLNCAIKNGQILAGGELDDQEKRITPTLIEIKDRHDPLME